VLDTSTVIMLSRITDPVTLPAEPLITTVTLAELTAGPLVATGINGLTVVAVPVPPTAPSPATPTSSDIAATTGFCLGPGRAVHGGPLGAPVGW